MVLSECIECGNEISNVADICPRCGCPCSGTYTVSQPSSQSNSGNNNKCIYEIPTYTSSLAIDAPFSQKLSGNCNKSINEIPTHGGLVTLATILGFGVLGGLCLGSYTRTKRLIQKGDYDEALIASKATYVNSLIVIVGVSAIIIGFILFIFAQ